VVNGVADRTYTDELAVTTDSICGGTGARILFGFGCIPAFAGFAKPLGGVALLEPWTPFCTRQRVGVLSFQ